MTDALIEFATAKLGPHWAQKLAIRRTMFDKQLGLHDDPAQFKACHAGRRGGKSDGIPKSSCLDVLDAGFNEVVLLVAETLKKAKALHWANLHSVVIDHKLPLEPNLQDARWTTPAGAAIQFWGLADPGAVELLRGFKARAARVDESATIAPMLPRLVEHVLEPALGDTGGALTLYGTPSVTRAGPWYDVCCGAEARKWAVHHWDVRANPHFRVDRGGGEAWLQEVLERNRWTWQHPTFQREYLGNFVDDTSRMVVEYVGSRDLLTELPKDYSLGWKHVAGVDYGFNDAFGISVLACDPYSPLRLFRWAKKRSGLTYDDAADMLAKVIEQFQCQQVVCDPAGGGKPFYETFNRKYGERLGVNVKSAHKVAGSVVESIRFQNTELRGERLKVYAPDAQELADEWQVLPWKDDWKDETDDSFPQDLFDAGRYALMETITWQPKERPKAPPPDEQLEREIRAAVEAKAKRDQAGLDQLRDRWG